MSTSNPFMDTVVVGDVGVGKTSLITAITSGYFPSEDHPAPHPDDNFAGWVYTTFEDLSVQFAMTDPPCNKEMDRLRPIYYQGKHLFLLLFDVNNHASLDNVVNKWYPEIVGCQPDVPYILCGSKIDLRNQKEMAQDGSSTVSIDEGVRMAKQIGAIKYLECSAMTREGLENVMNEAMKSQFANHAAPLAPKKKCIICDPHSFIDLCM